jgi:alanine racemase
MRPETEVPSVRRSWLEIDLDAIRHNAAVVREQVGPTVRIMAVVKANAYGHGAGAVVRALEGRVEMFGVANVLEAREVRRHLPAAELFILGPALPDERAEIARSGFIPSVSDVDEALAFAALAQAAPVPIHFIIDTGMGRIGAWEEEALETLAQITRVAGVRVSGIASHLPSADEDARFTELQLQRFHSLVGKLRDSGIPAPVVHIENSAGLLGHPAQAGHLVRPGIMLYGFAPLPEHQPRLRATLTWKARITLLRDVGEGRGVSYGRTFITPRAMRIATLGVGYADGYPRHLSGQNAHVLLGGRRCPVLGRVTMDQILVDVSAAGDLAVGDEAVLIGRQSTEEITVAEVAKKAGTIPWEIFTGIGQRVARHYVGDSATA